MDNLIILENLTAGLVVFTAFALGVIIYFNRPRSATHAIFSLFCLDIIFWTIANYLSLRYLTLFWIRLVLFFAAPQAILFFLFIHTFPADKIRLNKKLCYLLIFLLFLVMALALSPYLFIRLEPQDGTVVPIPGPSIALFAVLSIGSYLAGIFYAFKKPFLSEGGIQKKQWQYICGGFLITFFLVIIFNFISVVIFKESGFVRFGSAFFLPFVLGATIAITKYRIMNIKVISTEFLALAISLIFFVQIFISPTFTRLILNSIIFALVAIANIFLIKSVLKEIELKNKLQVTYEKLKRLDKAKSEFISIASHQLRTPLSIIKGYLSMAIEGAYGNMPEKIKEPVQRVFQANERLIKLVGDLLAVSRIEADQIKLNLEKTSLENLIINVIDALKIQAKEKNLFLVFEKPASAIPLISLDKEKFSQVILNLIDNAIRYTDKGGITVIADYFNGKIEIQIKDTGAGIKQEDAKELFKSFSRGHAGEKYWTEGTGLGLYIAQKFVDLHQGKIWVESEGKDKGTVFHIELPIQKT